MLWPPAVSALTMALTKHPARTWALVGRALSDAQHQFLHQPRGGGVLLPPSSSSSTAAAAGAPVSAARTPNNMNDNDDNDKDAQRIPDNDGHKSMLQHGEGDVSHAPQEAHKGPTLQSPGGALCEEQQVQSVAGSGGSTDAATRLKHIIMVRWGVWGVEGAEGCALVCVYRCMCSGLCADICAGVCVRMYVQWGVTINTRTAV